MPGLTNNTAFHLIARTLDLSQQAHAQATANLAQQDTPGYKARSLDFTEQMKQAIGQAAGVSQKATHAGHFGGSGVQRIDQVNGTQHVERNGATPDGNTVAPELEMARMAENQLMFDVASQIIAAKYRGIKNVIHEGR